MLKKVSNFILGYLLVSMVLVTVTCSCAHLEENVRIVSSTAPKYGEKKTNGKNLYSPIIRLYMAKGTCTGVVIDGNYALTAAHCIKQEIPFIDNDILIKDKDDKDTNVIAVPIASDPDRDVALIKGNFEDFQSYNADFKGTHIYTGMLMRSCGFPANQKNIFCVDLLLIGNENFQYKTIGAPLFRGMSGGPVFSTADNTIIGVNSGVTDTNVIISPLVGFLEHVGF